MKKKIDVEALLAPVPGDNPGGQDLRYSAEYDAIKEARKYDEVLDQGEWQTEFKKADWDRAINVAVEALAGKTKDLQIAVWLCEALIATEGFEGCAVGLQVVSGLLESFWDSLYPPVEDGDLEYRIAPFEFLNDKLALALAGIPITDKAKTSGYSFLQWQESRQIGYEGDVRDEEKRRRRQEYISEGKVTPEDFDAALTATAAGFYKSLSEVLGVSLEEFKRLDRLVDEKFGQDAPRLSDFGNTVEEINRTILKICRQKGLLADVDDQAAPEEGTEGKTLDAEPAEPEQAPRVAAPAQAAAEYAPGPSFPRAALVETGPWEDALWDEAVRTMRGSGIRKALEKLTEASLSAPSQREQSRYKLFLGKLCLEAARPDLARPVLEQLFSLIDELHLERWESPVWIADVFGALYRCLLSGEPSDDDVSRSEDLFRRMCTIDMTKALACRK